MCRAFAFLLMILCFSASPAGALPFKIDFVATGIRAISSSTVVPTAPQSEISGSFVYDALSMHAPIEAITSVDLVVAGVTYGLEDLAYIAPFWTSGTAIIGGAVHGANGMKFGEDDFWLTWGYSASRNFYYISKDIDCVFGTDTFSSFSLTALDPEIIEDPVESPTPVPEPSTFLLTSIGLVLVFRRLIRG